MAELTTNDSAPATASKRRRVGARAEDARDRVVPNIPNMCGANAGALLVETALTQRVVSALKGCGGQPEPYREPPGRRTRVLWASHLQGRFGNPATIPPLRRADGTEVDLDGW